MTTDTEAFERHERGRFEAAVLVLRRVPFTATMAVAIVAIGAATGTLWRPVHERSWFVNVAYGWPALREGKWWTPVSGWFFGLTPAQYITITIVFAVIVGFCEWRLGTMRTALVCAVGQIVSVVGASLIVAALGATNLEWATDLAHSRDVGFTTAMISAVAVVSATLRSPWRLRVRAVLLAYIAISFLFEGKLADVMHLIAVAMFLPIGERYFSTVERGFLPRTRREIRTLAFVGVLVIAVAEIAVYFFPGQGPLGPTAGDRGSLVGTAIDVVIIAIVANELRKGRNWAWWVTFAFGSLTVLGTLVALVTAAVVTDFTSTGAVTLGTGLLWLGLLTILVGSRQAFRVPRRRRIKGGKLSGQPEDEIVRELLARHGGSTMSWMTTWPENSYYFGADGERYLAYQRHAGTVITLADPVGPADELSETVDEFVSLCESAGLVPCLFSTSQAVADVAVSRGWRSVQIAEDTLIDLPALEFKGKPWQDVRSAINKAKKEDIEFQLVSLAEQPYSLVAQVRNISEEWVGDKGLPEMGFTLGGVDEALDPHVRVGLAVDRDGTVHGVTSWLPVYGPAGVLRGWTLDVMRRRPDGFRPVIEFLIASACVSFKEEGAEFVSLSGAPLAHSDSQADSEPIDKLLEALGAAMEPYYGFRSLHAFKAKFQPRHEPVFMSYRDEADLPRIGIALTRAYLPGVSASQLIRLTASKP